jgi:hypothetical protein
MTADDLDTLVSQWLLSMHLDAAPSGPIAPAMDVRAVIEILGQPRRLLALGLSRQAAATLAAQMTGLPPSALRDDPTLYQDLTNEAANVLAGNLWPTLAGATGIGLPADRATAEVRRELRRVYRIGDDVALVVTLGETVG